MWRPINASALSLFAHEILFNNSELGVGKIANNLKALTTSAEVGDLSNY